MQIHPVPSPWKTRWSSCPLWRLMRDVTTPRQSMTRTGRTKPVSPSHLQWRVSTHMETPSLKQTLSPTQRYTWRADCSLTRCYGWKCRFVPRVQLNTSNTTGGSAKDNRSADSALYCHVLLFYHVLFFSSFFSSSSVYPTDVITSITLTSIVALLLCSHPLTSGSSSELRS